MATYRGLVYISLRGVVYNRKYTKHASESDMKTYPRCASIV